MSHSRSLARSLLAAAWSSSWRPTPAIYSEAQGRTAVASGRVFVESCRQRSPSPDAGTILCSSSMLSSTRGSHLSLTQSVLGTLHRFSRPLVSQVYHFFPDLTAPRGSGAISPCTAVTHHLLSMHFSFLQPHAMPPSTARGTCRTHSHGLAPHGHRVLHG